MIEIIFTQAADSDAVRVAWRQCNRTVAGICTEGPKCAGCRYCQGPIGVCPFDYANLATASKLNYKLHVDQQVSGVDIERFSYECMHRPIEELMLLAIDVLVIE